MFRSAYVYKGRTSHLRNWAVKIQHRGLRQTLTLRSGSRHAAAAEACAIYRRILAGGWQALSPEARQLSPSSATRFEAQPAARLDTAYWAERLMRRDYTMSQEMEPRPEISVRIDHGGCGWYFPLGTNDLKVAAAKAKRIYQNVSTRGWPAVNEKFSRELTLGFHWLDRPLAWTYTTIHTRVAKADDPARAGAMGASRCRVAVVEPIAGIRRALAECLDRMEKFCCGGAFAGTAQAAAAVSRGLVQLVLLGEDLGDRAGAAVVQELKAGAPTLGTVLYSVHEDSEELFKTTPGGAGMYVLRRTGPSQFLDPVAALAGGADFSSAAMAAAVWQYFTGTFAAPPVGPGLGRLGHLTQREHDVLALISRGSADKEIADRLGISIHTVHEHVGHIFEKLGVHNRTEAAVKFLQK